MTAPASPDVGTLVSDEEWAEQVASITDTDAPEWYVYPTAGSTSGIANGCLAAMHDAVATTLSVLDDAAPTLTSGEVVDLLRDIERLRRRLPAIEHRLLAQVEQRGIHHDFAQPSTAALLTTQLLIAPAEAKARVSAAHRLGPRVSSDGQSLEPELPLVAEAQSDGHISERHVSVIRTAMQLLPPTLDRTIRDDVECSLVGYATDLGPRELAHVARRVLDHVDPDGPEPVADKAQRLRELTVHRRADGTYRVVGDLTPECGATWDTVLDALSKPVPDSEGIPDERTPAQRRHDGFLAAGKRLLRADELPDSGGLPASIIVRVDWLDLVRRSGYGRTAHGQDWPITDLLSSIGDEAEWTTVFGSAAEGVLAYGTDRRFATAAQTRALIARDGGCTFPGCDVPASWTDRHHIIPVVPRCPDDVPGCTDLCNLTLLCGYHHRMFEQAGWECLMIDGRPHWRPPPWIDPERTPRRNTHWDLL